MPESEEKPLVVIRSLVYNHEPYLRDCLEGFVMQQTTFPFVAVVHDDCSTDGSAAIIREYAEKYPHIIKPVYETENQYSKKDGSLRRAMNEACGRYGAKYYAMCEGDDCWTDPHKLQKQVDFLETHLDYTMVCCNCELQMGDRVLKTHKDFLDAGWVHSDEDRQITTEETIEFHGRLAQSAGLVYRAEMLSSIPPTCRKGMNGDMQLQLASAFAGKIYHLKDVMFMYRFRVPGSWSDNATKQREYAEAKPYLAGFIASFDAWDRHSGGRYHDSIRYAQERAIAWQMFLHPNWVPEIIKDFRHMFKRGGVSQRLRETTPRLPLVFRLCYYPYFPFNNLRELTNPLARPFYSTSGAKHTLHIGPVNILSYVGRQGAGEWFLFGRRVR